MAHKLIIIGAGKMGSALAAGLLEAGWCDAGDLALIARSVETRAELEARFPGAGVFAGLDVVEIDSSTGAILAVKPDYAESLARVAAAMGIRRVLSVVAGLSTARLESCFPEPVPVIRSMPNTPVVIGLGVTAMAGGSHVTSEDLDWAESILGAVGTVVRVTERNIDAVTGLSGPMPAYLYLVVEALIEAGVHQGLHRDVAKTLVVDTLYGSGALLKESGESPEVLRAQVTSPGGTTAAGLRTLEQRAVRAAFIDAVAAAAERSRNLAR
ncbi:MAG TPA: pyrroline-5-carboxylate reductase [Acidimicrobiales bacterium]